MQETICCIKCSTAPALSRERICKISIGCLCRTAQILTSHTGCHQRLLCVTHRGICYIKLLIIKNLLHQSLCTEFQELITHTINRFGLIHIRKYTVFVFGFLSAAFVDDLIAKELKNLGCTILAHSHIEQLRSFLDESGVALAAAEERMIQYIYKERDIGLNATDTHLRHRTDRLADRNIKITCMRDNLNQKTVIERCNYRTLESVTAVKTDAGTFACTVNSDLTGVRQEVVLRIFCGDTCLNGVSIACDGFLSVDTNFRRIKRISFCDQDL